MFWVYPDSAAGEHDMKDSLLWGTTLQMAHLIVHSSLAGYPLPERVWGTLAVLRLGLQELPC